MLTGRSSRRICPFGLESRSQAMLRSRMARRPPCCGHSRRPAACAMVQPYFTFPQSSLTHLDDSALLLSVRTSFMIQHGIKVDSYTELLCLLGQSLQLLFAAPLCTSRSRLVEFTQVVEIVDVVPCSFRVGCFAGLSYKQGLDMGYGCGEYRLTGGICGQVEEVRKYEKESRVGEGAPRRC